MQQMSEVVWLVESAVSHAETHEFHQVFKAGDGWIDFPQFSHDVVNAAHHSAAFSKMQHPLFVPFLQLNLEIGPFDFFEHSPAPFGFAENGSVALLEHYFILLEDL